MKLSTPIRALLACLALALPSLAARAQQPQTTTAPIDAVNAKYANGTAPGYWVTRGVGLQVNVSAGTSFCSGSLYQYAGGLVTVQANSTNYIFLDTANGCTPSVKFTSFTATDIPIGVVTAGPSSVSSIVDDRTPFRYQAPIQGSGGGGTSAQILGTHATCNNGYGTFGGVGCFAIDYTDNTWNPGDYGAVGMIMNITSTGQGQSGAVERGRGGAALNFNNLYAAPGINNDISSFSFANRVGDFLPMNWFNWGRVGTAEAADQGFNFYTHQGGEEEGAPEFVISGAQPGTTQPVVQNQVSNCRGGLFCLPTAGGYAQSRNEKTVVHMAAAPNVWNSQTTYPAGAYVLLGATPFVALQVNSGVTPGSNTAIWQQGASGWLTSSLVSETVPQATAFCYQFGIRTFPNVGSNTTIPVTVTCQGGTGSFSVGDKVTILGGAYDPSGPEAVYGHAEQSVVTAVSGSAPGQVLTIPLSRAEGNITVWKGGLAGTTACEAAYESMTSYAGEGKTNCPPVPVGGSLDGHTIFYMIPSGGGTDISGLPKSDGIDPSTYGGSSDSGAELDLYCSAKLTQLNSTANNPVSFNMEANHCNWADGSPIRIQNFPEQNTVAQWINVQQMSYGNMHGYNVLLLGAAAAGGAWGFNIENTEGWCILSDARCARQSPARAAFCSGCWNGSNSYWYNLIETMYSPKHALVKVDTMSPGQTSQTLFDLPGWSATVNLPTGANPYLKELDLSNAGLGSARAAYFTFPKPNAGIEFHVGICGFDACLGHTVDSSTGGVTPDANLHVSTMDSSVNVSNVYQGPATAPTGSCSTVGWAFSQDGHASFCNGSSWALKL